MKNERTGKKAASIAGRILEAIKDCETYEVAVIGAPYENSQDLASFGGIICTIRELKILAASCLTQAPDKPKSSSVPGRILEMMKSGKLKMVPFSVPGQAPHKPKRKAK